MSDKQWKGDVGSRHGQRDGRGRPASSAQTTATPRPLFSLVNQPTSVGQEQLPPRWPKHFLSSVFCWLLLSGCLVPKRWWENVRLPSDTQGDLTLERKVSLLSAGRASPVLNEGRATAKVFPKLRTFTSFLLTRTLALDGTKVGKQLRHTGHVFGIFCLTRILSRHRKDGRATQARPQLVPADSLPCVHLTGSG